MRAVARGRRHLPPLGTYGRLGTSGHADMGPRSVRSRGLSHVHRPETLRRHLGKNQSAGRALLGSLGVATLATNHAPDLASVLWVRGLLQDPGGLAQFNPLEFCV